MQLRFWGVRGSTPTPVPENVGYGGNTACMEVRLPSGDIVVIDGGTGARELGIELMRENAGKSLHLHFLLTHFHWDHIQGIPFFQPLYSAANQVTFYSMKSPEITEATLEGQMSIPYFPIDFAFLEAKRTFVDVTGKELRLGESRITSFPLNHPQGCYGYRIESDGAVLVIASDLEHGDPTYDKILLEAAAGADVLIFDAQFTPQEYEKRRGWGHSTWREATRVANLAGVKQLVLFHHDPAHDDFMLRRIMLDAQREFAATTIAKEGEVFQIGS